MGYAGRSGLVALLLASAATGQPAPLQHSGKWTVHVEQSGCVLERAYGPADRPTTLSFTPGPLGTRVGLQLLEPHGVEGRIVRSDAGSVTLDPGGQVVATMHSYGPVAGQHRLTSAMLPRVGVRDLILADTLTIDRGRAGPPVTIAPGGSVEAADALDRCEGDLLHRLGIDPDARPALSRRPEPVGNPRGWFRPDDYPRSATGAMPFGRALARVIVDADGRVRQCVILQGSGDATIDERTCATLRARARYVPALDPAGVPVAAPAVVPVAWEPHH